MNFKDLFEAAKLFKNDPVAYDVAYLRARKAIDWKSLHLLSNDDIKRVVLGFLNDWKCRLPLEHFDKLADAVKSTCERATPYLEALNNETLEDINFEEKKKVDGRHPTISGIIYTVFSMFCGIGHRFRWVAASKTLHMINSKLFVMWDNPICKGYFLKLNASSYAYEFMPLMKQHANEAVDTYMKYRNCGRETAIKEIMSSCYGKTLAKLVDEYNYMRFTKRHPFTSSEQKEKEKQKKFREYIDTLKEKGVPPKEYRRLIMEWEEKYERN